MVWVHRNRQKTSPWMDSHFGDHLANRRRATLPLLCFQLLGAVQPSQTEPEAPAQEPSPLWLGPKCGGRVVIIERLTAARDPTPFSPSFTGVAA
jgi:hypothetical protein